MKKIFNIKYVLFVIIAYFMFAPNYVFAEGVTDIVGVSADDLTNKIDAFLFNQTENASCSANVELFPEVKVERKKFGIRLENKKEFTLSKLIVILRSSTSNSAKAYTFVHEASDSTYELQNWLCEVNNSLCTKDTNDFTAKKILIRTLDRPDNVTDVISTHPIQADFKNYNVVSYYPFFTKSGNCNGSEVYVTIYQNIEVSNPIMKSYYELASEAEKQAVSAVDFSYNGSFSSTKINCDVDLNSYGTGSFEYEYCVAYKKVEGNMQQISAEDIHKSRELTSFKCDPYNFSRPDDMTDYYLNKSYMGAFSITTEPVENNGVPLQYVYNYNNDFNANSPGEQLDTRTKENVYCNKTCSEVVTVEYGPPVAIKAGFGFEYNVKVTSRVNCYPSSGSTVNKPRDIRNNIEGNPDINPTTNYSNLICTPAPVCYHGNTGWTALAAGPNEEFDQCIYNCDDGKYTEKCSKLCYSKVYESDNIGLSSSTILYSDYIKRVGQSGCSGKDKGNNTVQRCSKYDENGYYVRKMDQADGEVKILWKTNPDNPTTGLARYYSMVDYDKEKFKCVKNENDGGGIATICNCSAECVWEGCMGSDLNNSQVYLNTAEATADLLKNYEIYKQAVDKCSVSATCNTTEATLTISTKYMTDKTDQEQIVKFPYTRDADVVKFKNNVDVKNQEGTTVKTCNGCYDSNTDTNWYQAEWGFPGTWINGKTGEISFKTPDNVTSNNTWDFRKGKFYVPRNAKKVNEKWWQYYYTKLYANSSTNTGNSASMSRKSLCEQTCDYNSKHAQFTDSDISNISYNIFATARNFGYYNWNIDISCFYAIGELPGNTDECYNSCIKDDSIEYKVRSVDLENMFPNTDGSAKSDEINYPVPFNWSSFAETNKNSSYLFSPIAYRKWVEDNANSIYTDQYLDYEIKLNRNTIRELRRQKNKYGVYDGRIVSNSSVNTYRSPLFDSGGILSSNGSKYPTEDALKCNNMKSRNSGVCETY